jgi:hypothetical protein
LQHRHVQPQVAAHRPDFDRRLRGAEQVVLENFDRLIARRRNGGELFGQSAADGNRGDGGTERGSCGLFSGNIRQQMRQHAFPIRRQCR